MGTLVVDVDATAQPFREWLELALSLDDDMILHARAWSAEKKREDTADFHDLEFGISLPGEISEYEGATHDRLPESHQPPGHESGDLVVRSNLALEKDKSLVPGELLHTYDPGYFDVRRRPPDIQVKEYLYYQPCAVCRRGSSDPECRCASLYGRTGEV